MNSLSLILNIVINWYLIFFDRFQELDLSNQAYIFSDSAKETEWQHAVKSCLHPKGRYRKVYQPYKFLTVSQEYKLIYVLPE